MRRIGWMVVALGVMIGADEPSKNDAMKDEDSLRGTWTMVSFVINGEKVPEDQARTGSLVIKGDEYRPRFGANAAIAKITIDASKNPKAIDFTFTAGPQKGKTARGIYKLDGGTLTVCRGTTEGEARPSDFSAPAESGLLLVVWKRAVPGGGDDGVAVREERSRLKGSWKGVTYVLDGKDTPAQELAEVVLRFDGDGTTTVLNKGEVIVKGATALGPTAIPRTMDLTFVTGPQAGKTSLGIYEIDGETFRLCRAAPGHPRPKSFTSEPGSGHALMSYRKEKANMAAIEADQKRFEGSWRFESVIVEGREVPPGGLKASRLTLKGDTFEMSDSLATYRGTFRLDPSVTPRTIDMDFTEGPEADKTSLGIYELEGDTFKLCIGLTGKARPGEFVSKPGRGHALEVLKRQKP
jgi:uncharacterized protein (TIGR03067 family)